jgi:hypothetical protein
LCPTNIPTTSDRQTFTSLLAAPAKATPDFLATVAVTAKFSFELKISGTLDAHS